MFFARFEAYSLGMKDDCAILQLIKIQKEIDARSRDALANYNKDVVHRKQMEFHRSQKRNRWVFGGNRSGKTECGAVECVWLARGIHPFRQNRDDVFGWVVSLSCQVQRDVAQAKVLKYLAPRYIEDIVMLEGKKGAPEYGIIDYIVVKNAFGGRSKIGFKSCDQGREKFQGASLDFVWFDEEPPKDIYDECRMRVFDKTGDIFGTMTPLKGLTFIYDEIYLNKNNNPQVWCEFMEWADNPYLNENELNLLTSSLSDDELESRRYGRFHANEGLVYTEFDESTHVIEPFPVPYEWQDALSIDPGLNNPLSCHWYCVDYDNNVYVVAEHYEAGKTVDYHSKKIKEISEKIGWRKDAKGRITALIDSAANQRTLASEKSVTELFYENEILVNPKVNKDMFSGINRVKRYLKNKKIFIFKNCVNLIRELKSYRWGDGDLPKKNDDHCLDEMRYYLMSKPENSAPETQKSVIQIDKERRIKRMKLNKPN